MIQDGQNGSEGAPYRAGLSQAEPDVSALRASIPSALPDAVLASIADEFDHYIAKLTDNKFTLGRLKMCLEWEADYRSAAVCAVDSYHGFTCEFSPFPAGHISEYDFLEQMLCNAAQAIEAGTAKTEGLGAQHESAVHAPKHNQEPTNG